MHSQAHTAVPIHALFEADSRSYHHVLRDADVIFGIDVTTQNIFLVWGRKLLQKIVRANSGRRCRTFYVTLNQETEELEKFLTLVTTIKGSHNYEGHYGAPPVGGPR
jgi:hypothetical protein